MNQTNPKQKRPSHESMQPDAGPGNPVEKLVLNPIPETWDQAQVISHPDLSRKISRTTNPKGQRQGVVRAGNVKQLEPNQMNIPNKMIVNQVSHPYKGNAFAVVETLKDDWSRVVSVGGGIENQFFLVWSKLLTIEKNPIRPDLLPKINNIRDKLASGQYVVKNTRLVKA